ncbi:putative slit [Fasciolopsis buskii]|uniref:Putative slit n=1 Tax=Fasciolopsis buskii TaxID=27845 RepID=A0A8E0VKY9_9TREM|nr:putative slit [Fasciolopsis buski]
MPRNFWWFFVFFLWLLGLPRSQSICAPQLDVIKFQCTHARLIEVPGNINRLTEELDLSHNLIEVLHEDSFHGLHSLRRLVLSHNKIYKITERAFLAVAQTLTYLDLRNNQIMSNSMTSFPVTALAPLIHLTYLDLSANPLTIVPTEFLRHMGANLTQLDLSSIPTKVKIQPGAFRGLARLHRLNLAGNSFSEFNEDGFEGLRPAQFSQLSLHGVQWRCDCRLLWFRRWLNHVPRKALFADALPGGECISPPAFKGRSLLFLNLTDLQCAPRLLGTIPPSQDLETPEPVHVIALDGYNLTLSCVFVSEPKMQVHWYQNGVLIQPHWKRFTQTTSSGTKFTTSLHFHQLNSHLDIGTYQCQTSNQKGSAGKNFMVDIKTQLTPENGAKQIQAAGETEKPLMQAHELGKYLIILSIIAASNIVFFIVGAITYKCIKCRHRVRRKSSQTAYILTNGQSNQPGVNPTEQTEFSSNCGVPLLPITPGTQPMNNPLISHPLSNFHPFHYDYHLPEWQPGTIPTTTAATLATNTTQLWPGSDIQMPMMHQHPMRSSQAVVIGENFAQDLTHILSPHRTKRTRLFGEPPSPLSSDMGYSPSTSSRTADKLDPSVERSQFAVYKPVRPESASKQYNHHYTLTLKQNESNKTELVYQPRTVGSDKGQNDLRINPPCMRETTLAPHTLLPSQPHTRKTKLEVNDEIVQVIPKINMCNTGFEMFEDNHDPTCPVHGTDPHHTCVLHANIGDDDCPIHGSLLDTSNIEKSVEQLCALNERYRRFGTWSAQENGHSDYHQRYSNPNLTSIAGDYSALSDPNLPRVWKTVLPNNTLPR